VDPARPLDDSVAKIVGLRVGDVQLIVGLAADRESGVHTRQRRERNKLPAVGCNRRQKLILAKTCTMRIPSAAAANAP
jgi:hypothetical protein